MIEGVVLRRQRRGLVFGALLALAMTAACGGGRNAPTASIAIQNPTTSGNFYTTGTGVVLGGSVAGTWSVRVHNAQTGASFTAYVFYNEGNGTWFAEVTGLGFGDNPLTVTAGEDGARTASAQLTITRPLRPADLFINGPDRNSTAAYWLDASSMGHAIVLFAEGTGRSTTGSTMAGAAGPVVDITWSEVAPDAIVINNCPTCSFQSILRISGSVAEGTAYGQPVTAGGADSLHAFVLTAGSL